MTQQPWIVNNWRMRMYELIGRGVASARQRNGWTQERAARAFRFCGLTAWRTSTVGSLEAGLRRPRLDEVLLMCAALKVSLADLIVDVGEDVELGDGAVLPAFVIRDMLTTPIPDQNKKDMGDHVMWFPGEEKIARVVDRERAEWGRLKPQFGRIRQWGTDRGLIGRNWADMDAVGLPTDAERHAARRLGLTAGEVRYAAEVLWKRGFEEERDARVGDNGELQPRSRQARRGLVTRQMLAEMRQMLAEAYGAGCPPQSEESRDG
jgi:transcriptional regulator with XRE-family HTH domain